MFTQTAKKLFLLMSTVQQKTVIFGGHQWQKSLHVNAF
jgi:hypothetical protein